LRVWLCERGHTFFCAAAEPLPQRGSLSCSPASRRDRIRAVTPAKEKPIFRYRRWVSKGLKALRGVSKGAKPLWRESPERAAPSLVVGFLREAKPPLGLLADVGEDAAVYVEDVAVDEVGGVGGQEHGGSGQVLGVAPAVGGGLS